MMHRHIGWEVWGRCGGEGATATLHTLVRTWGRFSSCSHRPLPAPSLKAKPTPCSDSVANRTLQNPLPRHQTRSFDWDEANINASQSSHSSQTSGGFLPVSLLESLRLRSHPEHSAWQGSWKTLCGMRQKGTAGKGGDSLLVWGCPVHTVQSVSAVAAFCSQK